MAELQLWCVEVTRTVEVEGTAWVWADSAHAASRAAELEVDLDLDFPDNDDTAGVARQAPFTCLESIDSTRQWLVMPDGTSTDDIDEFRSVLTPEMQFVLQQREWERNGQMTLGVTA